MLLRSVNLDGTDAKTEAETARLRLLTDARAKAVARRLLHGISGGELTVIDGAESSTFGHATGAEPLRAIVRVHSPAVYTHFRGLVWRQRMQVVCGTVTIWSAWFALGRSMAKLICASGSAQC